MRIFRCAFGLLWLFLAGASVSGAQTYEKLAHPSGEPASGFGIYDPSLEYLPDGSLGWLFYSAVHPNGSPSGTGVSSRVALTTNNGADWSFVGPISSSVPATATSLDPNEPPLGGLWNYEVTSGIHDPTDPDPNRAWKIFVHRIFRQVTPAPERNRPDIGWIVFRTAPDPAGPWSSEVALFGTSVFPGPGYTTAVNVNLLDPNGSLAPIIAYSEPGAFVNDDTIYLSLTALTAGGPESIILLASDNHGELSPTPDWRYVATLLTKADAAALGYLGFDGSNIVEHNGRVFLLATPKSSTLTHDGTLSFEFADLASGNLDRVGGVPLVRNHIRIQTALVTPGYQVGGGQSAYHQLNTASGMLMPQFSFGGLPELFQIFDTRETPLGAVGVPVFPVLSPVPAPPSTRSLRPVRSRSSSR